MDSKPLVVLGLVAVLAVGLAAGLYVGFEFLRSRHEGEGGEKKPDVIYVPTPHVVVDKMLELAKVGQAKIVIGIGSGASGQQEDVVWDLGCGDGRIVIAAAQRGARGKGFDIDPVRLKESRENAAKAKVEDRVTFVDKDIFTLTPQDFRGVTVITMYLLPRLNERLRPVLEQLPPGVRIVSHDFDMKGAKPDKVIVVDADNRPRKVYLWVTPLKPE
jgi:SAM-dependent methyltransferase